MFTTLARIQKEKKGTSSLIHTRPTNSLDVEKLMATTAQSCAHIPSVEQVHVHVYVATTLCTMMLRLNERGRRMRTSHPFKSQPDSTPIMAHVSPPSQTPHQSWNMSPLPARLHTNHGTCLPSQPDSTPIMEHVSPPSQTPHQSWHMSPLPARLHTNHGTCLPSQPDSTPIMAHVSPPSQTPHQSWNMSPLPARLHTNHGTCLPSQPHV